MADDRRRQDEASAATVPVDSTAPAVPGDALPRGTILGRYVVLDTLGVGGMAVVHAAYDPELNRKVAIKLLSREARTPSGGGSRLLREAQSMAKLQHPNVVAVHDVGTLGDRVFVAMDLVEGLPLRSWLLQRERGWRETLAVFVLAGRGLAAAHAAGIVHRDFKPDNVLVGVDGSVRVADFGLATPVLPDEPDEPVAAEAPTGPVLSARLTRTGALIGTPMYMAPEQHQRKRLDERSDQFSFCVALYEALHREHPFGGGDLPALATAVTRGAVQPPPAQPRVPGWVRAALLRGLSVEPERRWPSMDALLRVLARDPAAGRRRALAAAVAIGVALGAVGVVALRRADTCAGATGRLAGVWDDARRGAVQASFAATGKPFAAAAAGDATRALDAYAAELDAMRASACRAAQRGQQSAEAFDLRSECLDRRQAQLDALAGLFTRADVQVVQQAAAAAEGLSPVAACANLDELRGPARLPDDPEARGRVLTTRSRLAEIAALDMAGKYKAALPLAADAVVAARAAGHPPLVAEALYALGRLQVQTDDLRTAETTLEDALFAAESARHDRMAAAAATQLVRVVSFSTPRYDEGRRWGRLAQAALDRMGAGAAGLDARLLQALGRLEFNRASYAEAVALERRALALHQGRGSESLEVAGSLINLAEGLSAEGHYEEALAHFGRALAIQQAHLGADHPDVAWTYKMLGTLAWARGRWEEARGHYLRAVDIIERGLGPDALIMASVLNNLAAVDSRLRRTDDVVVELRRAVAIWEQKLGADNPKVAIGRHNLGDAYVMAGRLAEARAELERARDIVEKALGPEHVRMTGTLGSLAELSLEEGDKAAARAYADRALAIAERGLGPDAVELARALHVSGDVRLAQGDAAGAVDRHRRELVIYEKARGPDSPALVDTLVALGRAQLAAGHAAEAVATLERALKLDDTDARARFRLAETLWAAGGDRGRARSLATSSLDGLAALGPSAAKDLADARTWLERHATR